jgi:DNA invertase Pin-like site-specific DNA recombinase
MLLGYARVSKSDDTQDTAAQVSALKSAGCKRVFEDKASGGRWQGYSVLVCLRTASAS